MPEHMQGRPAEARWRGILDWTAAGGAGLLSALALAATTTIGACAPQPQEPPAPATPPIVSAPAPSADAERWRTPPPAPGPRASTPNGPWEVDLERDEDRGGHTIARHVGRTDAQLQARLRRESISAASTYPDLETAERAVRRTLDEHTRRVQLWIDRRAPKANLAIRHRARDGLPTGRILARGAPQSRDAYGAVVVLRWRGEGWYVLTSYPEEAQ